jgi:hypothetical protein
MNDTKQALAFMSLRLFLAALLVPFIIAALGHPGLAVGFSFMAGLLALILWTFSRSERFGKAVTIALLTSLAAGFATRIVTCHVLAEHYRAVARVQQQAWLQAEVASHQYGLHVKP